MPRRKNDEYRPVKEDAFDEIIAYKEPEEIIEENEIKIENEDEKIQEENEIVENANNGEIQDEKVQKEEKIETEKSKKEDKVENKEDEALVNKQKTEISKIELETIEEEIKKQTTIPEEKKNKMNKEVLKNILLAIVVIAYFILVNLGYGRLEASTYLMGLKVASIVTIGITITIFEIAYKKDDDKICILGVEMLVLSICTLMTLFVLENFAWKYANIINIVSILFAIYYVGKSIVIYRHMKNKAIRRAKGIYKIGRIRE